MWGNKRLHILNYKMDTKFKLIITTVVGVVVFCLAAVHVVVLIMSDLPTTDRKDQICLPGETGRLTCGSTADLLHKYLEKVRLFINIISFDVYLQNLRHTIFK